MSGEAISGHNLIASVRWQVLCPSGGGGYKIRTGEIRGGGGETKGPARSRREGSSFGMPLAAMVPLGIITVALGLAGLGMGGVHYAFTGEV